MTQANLRQPDPTAGGFYTIPEAVHFLNMSNTPQISESKIRDWLSGRKPSKKAGKKTGKTLPVISRQYDSINKRQEMGFLDLMEVRFINHYRGQGISMQTLRKAAQTMREEFKLQHPFATDARIYTSQKEIFLKTAKETGDVKFLNLVTKQFSIYQILTDFVQEGLRFNDKGVASSWQPDPCRFPNVILDPHIAFGRPVIQNAFIPTSTLYQAWLAEDGNLDEVAYWHDIDAKLVLEAVKFEHGMVS